MKKKIISLLLITAITSTALISCGKKENTETTTDQKPTTEQASSPAEDSTSNTKDSKIIGEKNNPTVEVKQIGTIADFKNKDKAEIEKLLGSPSSQDESKAVYEKDNYTFEITYSNSKCNKIKIIPKAEMKFPADGANLLKLLGINAGESDKLSPAGLEWNDKFETSKITVASNNEPDGKITFAEIVF
jgi:hypothetical protein